MKIDREKVVSEHVDGAPHMALDEAGRMIHYPRAGVCAPNATHAVIPDGEDVIEISLPEIMAGRGGPVSIPTKRHAGPARVTSDAYRDGWDAIWSRGPRGQA